MPVKLAVKIVYLILEENYNRISADIVLFFDPARQRTNRFSSLIYFLPFSVDYLV